MGLFDKIKIRLYEVKKEPPIKSGSVDPADQQGDFVKNERDKKKIMRKLEPKSKQTELNLGNTKTTNTPKSTKRTLKGRPLGSKTKKKGETYKQLTTGSERQRQRKDIKRQFKTQQPISDLKKAKKYAIGEYPKIGGGERISPKSKGTGASTGGTRIPPATVGGKSKGTTLRKVNITKPIKQSEVSKKAKAFTADINKKRTKRVFPGDKSGAYQRVKADIEVKNLIKKAGGSGDIGFTAPDRKTKVAKRTTRAIEQGTPDPFKSKTKFSQKEFEKTLKKSSKGPSTNIVDPFGKGITKGQANVKGLEAKAFRKTQPRDVKLPKSFTDFSKKLKTFKADVAKTSSITPTIGVNQADVSRKAKKFSQDISNKVQMRGGATNIPAQPTKPPKKYNIPIDDRPGKLVQGRDFPSKKAYDAKIAKQVKILRDKADRLRTKQIKLAKTTPTKGTPEYETRRTGVKKIGRRMKQRRITADALERSLKRKGTIGPTSMLPVVSGKGADAKMPGMGGKTYKQFYKDADVGARSKFKKVIDKVTNKATTSKIGSKVVKGLSKSRYGRIAGAVLGATGAVAGISALSKREPKGVKLTSKDFVRGPVIKDLSTGKPKRFQLGQKITADDLKNTTYTKKIKINA